jgi:hypothetical protein
MRVVIQSSSLVVWVVLASVEDLELVGEHEYLQSVKMIEVAQVWFP